MEGPCYPFCERSPQCPWDCPANGGCWPVEQVIIKFDFPDRHMNLNDRLHWAEKARRESTWRQAAKLHTMANVSPPRAQPRSIIEVTFCFRQKRRRDAHNLVATVKPIIDGLVDAKLWPDDTGAYVVTTEPVIKVIPALPRPCVYIRITPVGRHGGTQPDE